MNFRSQTLHLRWTYSEPPKEVVLVETLEAVTERIAALSPAPPVFPRTKAEYPPEIPKEVEPVDLPLIHALPPESVKWLRNPLEPVERTMPAPVRHLLKRTRKLYLATKGCLASGGVNTVCLKRYGRTITRIRKALTRPKQKTPVRLLTPVRKITIPARKTVPKSVVIHTPPAGIGCVDYAGYSFIINWEGDNIGNMQLVVKLNGTQIFDTGLTGNGSRSLTLKTDAAIPEGLGIFNGLFSRSLFMNSGNILKLEFTGDFPQGLNAIHYLDQNGWNKDGAFWSPTATYNQLIHFTDTPFILAPPAIGQYPLTYNLGVVGVC